MRSVSTHPTPQYVFDAIRVIADWLREIGAVEALISHKGGAAFHEERLVPKYFSAWAENDTELAAARAALLPFAEQRAGVDDLLTARRVLGLPDFPPVNEAMAELRELVGGAFDGVDADAYVRELRDDDEARRA